MKREGYVYIGEFKIKNREDEGIFDCAYDLNGNEIYFNWENYSNVFLYKTDYDIDYEGYEFCTKDLKYSSCELDSQDVLSIFEFTEDEFEILKNKNKGEKEMERDLKEMIGAIVKETLKENGKTEVKEKNSSFGMFKNLFKGFEVRELKEDEIGTGFDGKMFFKRKDGDYVRFDSESDTIINAGEMVLNFGMAMIIPSNEIKTGDIIAYKDDFCFVKNISEKRISGISIETGRERTIVKEKSIIGVNFYPVVKSMTEGFGINCSATSENQGGMFGNMNPMQGIMMMQMMSGDENSNKSEKMKDLMMAQMMFGMFSKEVSNKE